MSIVHPLTGPVYVNGAEPGDLLEVSIVEITPEPFGFTAQMGSGSNANYNGLQVQFTRRMSNGLQFLAGYTFARNISNNEGEEGGYSDGGAPLGQTATAELVRTSNDNGSDSGPGPAQSVFTLGHYAQAIVSTAC